MLPPGNPVPNWHLFFTFRNRSGRERSRVNSDVVDRPFAFAFQPLFPDGSTFIEDGSHTLIMYRADKLSQLSPDIYLTSPSTLNVGMKADQLTIPPGDAEDGNSTQRYTHNTKFLVLYKIHSESYFVRTPSLGACCR